MDHYVALAYRWPMESGRLRCQAVALIVVGLWIADVMAQMRKNRDCVLTGRLGCTQVEAPVRER